MTKRYQHGSANGWTVAAIGSIILLVIVGALAAWAYIAYTDEKKNVDSKIALAVAEAKREQLEVDQKKFAEEAKNPRQEFVGPEDYGRLSFLYPKTWSVFVERDASDRGDFKAYLHPQIVPPLTNKDSRFALRVEIMNRDYDSVVASYENLLKKGDLSSSTPEYNGLASTRFDGAISKEVRGSAVLMRVRDKTIRFSTDAETFRPDMETILETVKLVQ